jgi:hypothetical protein
VSGIVVDDLGRSVRLAIVTLVGGPLAESRSTVTDDDGRFAFRDVPPGRFTLSSRKVPYIGGVYGVRRPGGAATALVVAAGQTESDLLIVLTRGAVVTGTIRGHDGEPAASTEVSAIAVTSAERPRAGARRSTTATTDERGVYRIFGLAPGRYLIAARPRITGAGNVVVMSEAEVDRVLRDLRRRVQSAARSTEPPARAERSRQDTTGTATLRFALAATFYPGTAHASSAVPLTLDPGDERLGVDFRLDLVPIAAVRGVIVMPDASPPPPLRVDFEPQGPALEWPSGWKPAVASTNRDGRFELWGVLPGDYVLTARSAAAAPAAPGTSPSLLWAKVPVTVFGADVSDLRIVLQPGVRFAGRVVFRGAPPVDLTRARVTLEPVIDPSALGGSGGASRDRRSASLHPDGTFEITGLLPGRYQVDLLLPGTSGWSLQSVASEGVERLDEGLEFAGADVTGAVLTCSDRQTRLSGRLLNAALRPAPDYFIIVYPQDRGLWRAGSRRIQAARPDSDGRYLFAHLPPGQYLLSAVPDLQPGVWNSPESLETFINASVPITLVEGQETTQDLRLAR